MNTYPVRTNSLVAQDQQVQDSAQANRPASTGAPHVSALPEDTVTLSSTAKAKQTPASSQAQNEAKATPNKSEAAANKNPARNSASKG